MIFILALVSLNNCSNEGLGDWAPESFPGIRARADLLVHIEQCHHGDVIELVTALEEGDLDYEQVADQRATELLDQVACSGSRTA